MSKSVRISASIPIELAERLENYAVSNGNLTTTQALIALIVNATPKLHDQPKAQSALTADPHKQLVALRKQIKPLVAKADAETITPSERQQMTELAAQIKTLKIEVGEVAPAAPVNTYHNAEREQEIEEQKSYIEMMTKELTELNLQLLRGDADESDRMRAAELPRLIRRFTQELANMQQP